MTGSIGQYGSDAREHVIAVQAIAAAKNKLAAAQRQSRPPTCLARINAPTLLPIPSPSRNTARMIENV